MRRIYLALLLVIYAYNVLLAGIGEPYCFQFTWVGPKNTTKLNNTNIPCVKPIMHSDTKPNTTELWENWNDKNIEDYSQYFCKLKRDNVCIRYTYMYNDAIVNVSYFCGKVIEDQTTAVTSGCYAQHTEGYIIEACACQSRNNSLPCNAAIQNTYSMLIIILAATAPLFMYKIFTIF